VVCNPCHRPLSEMCFKRHENLGTEDMGNDDSAEFHSLWRRSIRRGLFARLAVSSRFA
jgi:hypothetical protein